MLGGEDDDERCLVPLKKDKEDGKLREVKRPALLFGRLSILPALGIQQKLLRRAEKKRAISSGDSFVVLVDAEVFQSFVCTQDGSREEENLSGFLLRRSELGPSR